MTYIDQFGFHRTRLDQYLANITAGIQGIFGADIDVAPDSLDGQTLGIYAEGASDLAGVLEDVYNGRSPGGAIGAGLARLVRLNGLTKKDPAFSTAPVTLSGTPATLIPQGSLVGSSTDPSIKFQTVADYTIAGGGTVAGQIQALVAGPISAASGTLTVPLTVIAGWTMVTNTSDATPGTTGETDGALRARRAKSVALPGQGMLDSLLAALLQVAGVTAAIVRENHEDTTQTLPDGGTLVAHAIQAIVDNGTDADVANAMWLKRFPGCTMVGATSVDVTDSQGKTQTVKFDRPVDTDIYVEVHTASPLSVGNQTLVQNAIAARGVGKLTVNNETLPGSTIGETVSVSDVYDAITALKLTTIPTLKVSKIFIGTAPSPTLEADIAIAFDHIARWASSRVTFASP